ncbi:Aldehyde dehydrogenase [Pseudocercospora fuligena]|uniref:aldehyde dehydrogenase (NAD(+)) n=1 Tax=Pseudocercospora fuligena TaxID=685502 RepID=A0A8H6VIV0_9PEZI|nr:Aldehyde dehydrogenase [Pseudocercospora fuligena]
MKGNTIFTPKSFHHQASKPIETRLYINGTFKPSSDGKTFEIKSPYTHQKVADVSEASIHDTNLAVSAAKSAFPKWSTLSLPARGKYLKTLATLIRSSSSELAELDALSMGRPISTYFDAVRAAEYFEHYAEAAWDAKGESSLNSPGFVNLTLRQPYGVVAAIIPWNIPVAMWASKVAPAVAAGCTVVVKSSEKAPLSSAKLATLVHEAGFPPGVINVLNGHGTPCGSTLAEHMDVRLINFTGSTATGRKIQVAAANSNLKKVVLELGGKSPVLVFEDADVEKAAVETAQSLILNSGQICMAGSRIYVQGSVAEKFKSIFVKAFSSARKGDPLDPETQQGPQADKLQFERVKTYFNAAEGTLLTGGKSTSPDSGYFIEPTAYTNVPEDSQTQKEEIFGPFVNINTFSTEPEALKKANATEYGLYASVYTRDLDRALRVAKAFESGAVAVNCTSPTSPHDMPFGGWKESGQGRALGFGCTLEEYLEVKSVMIKLTEET